MTRAAHGCRCSPPALRPAATAAPPPGLWRTTRCRMPWSWPSAPRVSMAWCWTRGATRLRWTGHCSTACCTRATPPRNPETRRRTPERKPPARAAGNRRWNALKKPPSLAAPWAFPGWQTASIRAAAPGPAAHRPAACGRKPQRAARCSP